MDHHKVKCVECSGRKAKTLEDYKNLALHKQGFYILEEIPAHTGVAVAGWKCENGHIWSACFNNISCRDSWCPTCLGVGKRMIPHYIDLAKEKLLEYVLEYVPNRKDVSIEGWKCSAHMKILDLSYDQVKSVDIPCSDCLREKAESKNNITV